VVKVKLVVDVTGYKDGNPEHFQVSSHFRYMYIPSLPTVGDDIHVALVTDKEKLAICKDAGESSGEVVTGVFEVDGVSALKSEDGYRVISHYQAKSDKTVAAVGIQLENGFSFEPAY